MNAPRLVLLAAVLTSTATFAAAPAKPGPAKPPAAPTAPAPAGATRVPAPSLFVNWAAVTSDKGDFRASFPEPPQKRVFKEKTGLAEAEVTSYTVKHKRLGIIAVNVYQFPAGTFGARPTAESLDGLRDEFLVRWHVRSQMQDEVTTFSDANGKSLPARRLEEIVEGGYYISGLLILSGDRVYQLLFVRNFADNELFQKFVSTFALL